MAIERISHSSTAIRAIRKMDKNMAHHSITADWIHVEPRHNTDLSPRPGEVSYEVCSHLGLSENRVYSQ